MQPYSLPSDSTYLIAFTRLTAVVGELDIFLISFALALDLVIQVKRLRGDYNGMCMLGVLHHWSWLNSSQSH